MLPSKHDRPTAKRTPLDRPAGRGVSQRRVGEPTKRVILDSVLLDELGLRPGLVWRRSPVFGGRYLVSDHGQVYSTERVDSLGRRQGGRLLKPSPDTDGYPHVVLHWDGERVSVSVHVLVCRAHHGEPPGEIGCRPFQWQVDHINDDRSDARAVNLEWVTSEENRRRARKLDREKVRALRYRFAFGEKAQTEFAEEYGVTPQCINAALLGITWADAGGPLHVPAFRRGVH